MDEKNIFITAADNGVNHLLLGAVGGSFSSILVLPLAVKERARFGSKVMKSKVLNRSLRFITLSRFDFLNLSNFRGWITPAVYGWNIGFYFCGLHNGTKFLQWLTGRQILRFHELMVIGGGARIIGTMIAHPLYGIRMCDQSEISKKYKVRIPRLRARQTLRARLIRDTPFGTFMFSSYTTYLEKFESMTGLSRIQVCLPASFLASVNATIISEPFDCIQTLVEKNKSSSTTWVKECKNLVKKQGVGRLWKNVMVFGPRKVLFTTIAWTTFEMLNYFWMNSKFCK